MTVCLAHLLGGPHDGGWIALPELPSELGVRRCGDCGALRARREPASRGRGDWALYFREDTGIAGLEPDSVITARYRAEGTA